MADETRVQASRADDMIGELSTQPSCAPAPKASNRMARLGSLAATFLPAGTTDLEIDAARPLRVSFGGSRYFLSFVLFVVLPSAVVALYLAFLATNQYYVETRFAVRKAAIPGLSETKSALSALANGEMHFATEQDAYIISNYIHSRAIIDVLSHDIDIRAIFTRSEADYWAKLKSGASREELAGYWNQMVSTYIDGPSGIVSVGVRSFRAEDSLSLSNAIVAASEKLANDVSARIRLDAVTRSSGELRRSESLVATALSDLKNFRNDNGFLDPGSAAQLTSRLLLQLLAEKIELQNNIFVATRAMSDSAPTVQAIKTRLTSLESQIDTLRQQLTSQSSESKALASSLTQYEQLDLKRLFAEKLYSLAQDSLEAAKRQADNQSIYVSVFVPPAMPEKALFPKRLSLSLIFSMIFLAIWGIFALLVASVEDHQF